MSYLLPASARGEDWGIAIVGDGGHGSLVGMYKSA